MLASRIAFSAGSVIRLSIGFFTWLAAARIYPAEQVGMAASAISAMLLCVEVGILGVDVALVALFPEHRQDPRRLMNTALTVGVACSLGAGLLVLGAAGAGFRALHFLIAHPLDAPIFLVLVVFQSAWWLMDQSAVALRVSEHVPTRAIAAGTTTLSGVIVIGVAGEHTAGAILAAWMGAALVACLVGRRQLRRAISGYRMRPQLASPLSQRLLSVGLPNFAVTAADIAPSLLLPIVASQQLSPRAAAYWYTVWMMAFAAYSVPWSFGLHLFAELAEAPEELARRSRESLRSGIIVAGVATVVLIALGPLVLSVLGHQYAAHGSGPLRLAALAAIPMVVLKAFLYTCRAVGRIREGALTAACTGIVAISLAVAAAPSFGLTGIAGAWLIVESVAAVYAALRFRTLITGTPSDGGATGAAPRSGGEPPLTVALPGQVGA